MAKICFPELTGNWTCALVTLRIPSCPCSEPGINWYLIELIN